MSNYSIYWIPLIFITIGISLWFIHLYLQEKDKRKLMFGLGFFTSGISFLHLTLDYHDYYPSLLGQNIFLWMGMPFIFAIFIAVNANIFKLEKFDSAFNLYLGLFFVCLILIAIPLDLKIINNFLKRFIAFEIIIVACYLLYRNKDLSNLLFLISMFCFSVAGFSMAAGQENLSIFAFLIAEISIALIFFKTVESGVKDEYSIDSYFSMKNKLNGIERALEKSEENYRILFDKSIDAIMTLAPPSWRFTSGNPATIKLFGAKDEAEFITKGPWDVSPEFQPDGKPSSVKAKEMIGKAMREGSNYYEWTHKRFSGLGFTATVLLTRVEVEKGKPFLQATVRDITERKLAEKELRKTISDLERFNRLAVGRELQMIDLKNEINNLLLSIGRDKKYKIPTLEYGINKMEGKIGRE